jgi:hypothetical protein
MNEGRRLEGRKPVPEQSMRADEEQTINVCLEEEK